MSCPQHGVGHVDRCAADSFDDVHHPRAADRVLDSGTVLGVDLDRFDDQRTDQGFDRRSAEQHLRHVIGNPELTVQERPVIVDDQQATGHEGAARCESGAVDRIGRVEPTQRHGESDAGGTPRHVVMEEAVQLVEARIDVGCGDGDQHIEIAVVQFDIVPPTASVRVRAGVSPTAWMCQPTPVAPDPQPADG